MPPCGLRIQGDSGAKQLGGPEPVALGYEQSELAELVGGRPEEREREEDRTTLGGRLGEATQASARQEAEENEDDDDAARPASNRWLRPVVRRLHTGRCHAVVEIRSSLVCGQDHRK